MYSNRIGPLDGSYQRKVMQGFECGGWVFSESIREWIGHGMTRRELVLETWEKILNRVAKTKVGEKVMMCGRAVNMWWDDKIQLRIEQRKAYSGRW